MKQLEKQIIRKANQLKYSADSILLCRDILTNRNFKRILDRRYNLNKGVISYLQRNPLTGQERQRVLELKKKRAKAKQINTVSIYNEPLVKDYIKNKQSIKYIHDNFIQFYGRNHHAKNAKDLRILAILKKHFNNRKK